MFIPAVQFEGSKPGFVFKNDHAGLGYYSDPLAKQPDNNDQDSEGARSDEEGGEGGQARGEEKPQGDEADYFYPPIEEEEEEEEEEEVPDGKPLSAKQRRLQELRKRMKKCRKDNQKAVQYEQKRKRDEVKSESQLRKEEYDAKRKQREEELKARGIAPDREYMLHSALKVEEQGKKKKKKEKNSAMGWDIFGQDHLHNAHKKRVKKVPYSVEEYEAHKAKHGVVLDPNAVGMDSLEYADEPLSRLRVDRMVNELEEQMERRKKFKRRREFNEESDVSYINERNRIFNEKIARDFDKYTTEVRQNFERGTAL